MKVWRETGPGAVVELNVPVRIAYGTAQGRHGLRLFRKIKVKS